MTEWRDGGRWLTTPAGEVFVRSAPGDGPTILLLHGYPSSSFDYHQVVPHLAGRAWVTLDFLGFGLSDKPRPHRYSLLEQADIVQTVVAETTSGPVVLVAHDMGTSVTTELLARDLAGALAVRAATRGAHQRQRDPAPRQPAADPEGAARSARSAPRPAFQPARCSAGSSAGCSAPDHPLSAEEADAQWALMSHNGGHRIAHLLISYLDERVRYASRWHGAVRDWPKPLSFLWALDDPVATTNVLDGLRELRPAADVVELPGVGHYPQVEVPEVFTRAALSLLSTATH